jgi:hypothetical protein
MCDVGNPPPRLFLGLPFPQEARTYPKPNYARNIMMPTKPIQNISRLIQVRDPPRRRLIPISFSYHSSKLAAVIKKKVTASSSCVAVADGTRQRRSWNERVHRLEYSPRVASRPTYLSLGGRQDAEYQYYCSAPVVKSKKRNRVPEQVVLQSWRAQAQAHSKRRESRHFLILCIGRGKSRR